MKYLRPWSKRKDFNANNGIENIDLTFEAYVYFRNYENPTIHPIFLLHDRNLFPTICE